MTKDAPSPSPPSPTSVWSWWKELQENDRAGRAELRRCGTAVDVAFAPAFHRLTRRLGSRLGEMDARRVAILAAVLSHVESEPSERSSFAKMMATPKAGGKTAVVSDARFRHLLRGEEDDLLFRELIRVVRQLDRKAPVDGLFRDLMRWDDATRMRWARDYYEAAPRPQAAS